VRTAGADSEAVELSPQSLVGRDDELTHIYGLIDGIRERGGALIVRGEAGIGKSALLAAASARARASGVTVMTTTGAESEARLAFAGLHQLLLAFLKGLDRLPRPQRRALETAFGVAEDEAPDLFLIGLATLSLVAETATEAPLLLVVDDAQWLDRSSSDVLAFVARRLEMEPAILLFAVREGMRSGVDQADLPELRLAGLNEPNARALLEVTGTMLSPDLKARILFEAAGNPLALLELPLAAAHLEFGAAGSLSEPLPLTARLEQSFAARLEGLDDDARSLLLLAALDDGELGELNVAAEALRGSAVTPHEFAPVLAAGLGTIRAGRLQFRHPLIRSAVVQSATISERRRAHAALAKALAHEPDRAVWHRAAATTEPDDEVSSALDAMAERARLRGDRDVATQALARAAELTVEQELRALRFVRAGELALELGRSAEAARLMMEARQFGLPPRERATAEFHLEALEGIWLGAATVRGFARIAADFAKGGDDRRALEALEAVALRAHWSNLDDETRGEVTRVVDLLDVPENDSRRLSVLALIDPVGRGKEVIECIRRLSPLGIAGPIELLAIGNAASAVWADDLALPYFRTAAAGFRADGRLTLLGWTLVSAAWAELRRGAVRGTITTAAEGARLAEETAHPRYVAAAKLAHAIAAAERDEETTAEHLITEAEAIVLPMGANPMLALVLLARGRRALAFERYTEAYENLGRLFDPADVAYQPFVRGWALADLVDAALHGDGDLDVVRGLLAEWERIAAGTAAPHLDVQLKYTTAVLADDAAAEGRFRTVITSAAATWPFYAARAQLAYGAWLRRQRRSAESRTPLREAAQSFDALGLVRFAERARRELRASGESARLRLPEAWAQLTPQELQIAQFAAEGLTNREIGERLYLSHRTVGSHLYRLFPKLGVTSRAQLRDALNPAHAP
jgi:DNA-binding CsgD family transcriptional regulator